MAHGSSVSDLASAGPGIWRSSPLGRLAIPLFVFMMLSGVFSVANFPNAPAIALAVVLVLELLFYLFMRKLRQRFSNTAISLQSQLHDLKQQEFDLDIKKPKKTATLADLRKTRERLRHSFNIR